MSEPSENPSEDEVYPIKVLPPEGVGHDPHRLGEWLSRMSFELKDADDLHIYPTADPIDAGGADWVTVLLTVKTCSGRTGEPGEDSDEDSDEGDDEGGDG